MRTNDNFIKNTIRDNIQGIDDDSFTQRIVENHLTKKQIIQVKPFANFLSCILGLSFLIISLGFELLIKQNNDWITKIGITENHGLIIVALSITFLIYKLMEEFTTPSNASNRITANS